MATQTRLEFDDLKKLKAEKLFLKDNIFKSVIKLIVTGFLLSLMSGIYVFADQLIMSIFVPNDGLHGFNYIFSHIGSYDEIKSWLAIVNNSYHTNYSIVDSADIVKSALALSNTITLIFNCVPVLIAMGGSVLFAQALANKNLQKSKQIYKTSFYCALLIGLFFSFVFTLCSKQIIITTAGKTTNWEDIFNKELTAYDQQIINYFNCVRDYQINWAADFSRMMAIGSFFNVMMTYYMYMIRTEGRNLIVTLGAITCNFINIIFDFILIKFAKMGMASAGTATLIGWMANFIFYQFYIFYLNKHNATILNPKILIPFNNIHISYKLAIPIIILGFTVFSRNLSNSIASIFFMSNMNNTINNMHIGVSGQYFQQLSGAVLPINNLLYYAMFGICDGVRPMVSYCFSKNDIKRIKQTTWIIIIISFIYGMCVFALFWTRFSPTLISLFGFNDPNEIKDATTYLIIQSLNISFVALSVGGLMIFQATNNMFQAFIASIIQGSITFWIVMHIVNQITYATNNPFWLPAVNPINNMVAGLIILTWSMFYLYKFLGYRIIKIPNKICRIKIAVSNPKLSFARKQIID